MKNLEQDIKSSAWIRYKIRNNDSYAQNFYAALCGNHFQRNEFISLLKGETWHCTWIHAGVIISQIRQEESIYWYYSGMSDTGSSYEDDDFKRHELFYVREGEITKEVEQDLKKIGWLVANNLSREGA